MMTEILIAGGFIAACVLILTFGAKLEAHLQSKQRY